MSCALLGTSVAAGQDDDRLAQSLLQNVVRIEAPREDSSENGFGFVVGELRGKLYIATAKHVVGDSQPDGASGGVKVIFFDDQATRYDAEIVSTSPTHDLAVLRVQKPEDFPYVTACLSPAGMPKRGTRVWAIGKLQKWKLLPGRLASDRPSSGQEIEIDELQVSPGSSGGLLVAATGIVGMVEKDSADDARALSIDFIREYFLDRDHNFPWALQPLGGSGAAAASEQPTAPTGTRAAAKDDRRELIVGTWHWGTYPDGRTMWVTAHSDGTLVSTVHTVNPDGTQSEVVNNEGKWAFVADNPPRYELHWTSSQGNLVVTNFVRLSADGAQLLESDKGQLIVRGTRSTL